MSDFLSQYGLWILIAILVVIVVLRLLASRSGRKAADASRPSAPPSSASQSSASKPPAAQQGAPAATPLREEPPVESPPPVAEPVTLVSGAETIVVTPMPEARPEAGPEAATGARAAGPDNLLLLKGVGPKLNTLLAELGVTSFAQIAAWTDADIAAIDGRLGNFKGRPVRDQWVDQASYLARGDTAGYEAKYGKL